MKIKTFFNKPGDNHYLVYETSKPTAIRAFVEEYGREELDKYIITKSYTRLKDVVESWPPGSTYTKKNYKRFLTYSYRKNRPIWYIYSSKGYLVKPFSNDYTRNVRKMLLFSTREEARHIKLDNEKVGRAELQTVSLPIYPAF